MFPGSPRRDDPRQARGRSWASSGRGHHLRELDAEANRLSHAVPRRSGCSPATTSPSASRTTRGSSRSRGAPTTPASTTPPSSSRLTTDEMAYIVDDCGAQAFITSRLQGRRRPPSSSPTRRRSTPRLHARRGDRRLRVATRTPSPRQPADAAARRPGRGHATCSTRSGTTGRPEGREGAAARRAARHARPAVRARSRCCSASPPTRVYLSPAPLYHAAPLRFCMAVHRVGGTVDRDGALRPRARRWR